MLCESLGFHGHTQRKLIVISDGAPSPAILELLAHERTDRYTGTVLILGGGGVQNSGASSGLAS